MFTKLAIIAALLASCQAQDGNVECLLDVGFVVDRSGSIEKDRPGEGNWGKVQQFLSDVVGRLEVSQDGTRVGLVSFDNMARVHFELDDFATEAEVMNQVSNLPYFLPGGNTNTTGGMLVARQSLFIPEAGDRGDVNNVLILLTDGKTTRDIDLLPGAVNDLKNDGVHIIGVGVTNSIDEAELKSLVSDPSRDYLTVADFDVLGGILDDLISQACRSTATLPPPSTDDSCYIDLAIAVDGSGSIEVDNPIKGNWALVQNFLVDIIRKFDIGLDKTRVGMVKFDDLATLHFDLDQYSNQQSMIDAVRDLNFNTAGGQTNTDAGLRAIIDSIFVSESGDRPSVRNVLLILTDGHPTAALNGNLINTVNELKRNGVMILSVGVTDDVDEPFMRSIVSNPETDYIPVGDFNMLSGQLDNIVEASCVGPTDPPPPASDCLMDLALVVDRSGSIEKDNPIKGNWAKVQNFLADLTLGFDVGLDATRIGVVTFDNTAELHFDLDHFPDKSNMVDFLRLLPYFEEGGQTNTNAGLQMARNSLFVPDGGDRAHVPNVLLLFTDGKPTTALNNDLLNTVQQLKNEGVRIIGIGVTEDVDEEEMLGIVSDRNTDYFSVEDFDRLNLILDLIINEACEPPPTDCVERADVYMVLDGSGSIDENNFKIMKDFAIGLLNDLDIDTGRTRAGVLMFSDAARPMFSLNQFNSREEMMSVMEDMDYPRGRTNTPAAIRYVRDIGFTANNGDREDVPNILVLFTDGNSNDPESTMREAYLAKQQSIHIICIGIGDWTNVIELRTIASYPETTNYIAVNDFTDLSNDLRLSLRDRICDNQNECASDPCINGGTCVNAISMYMCVCPPGFAGVNCQSTCRLPADVAFVIDSSGSLGQEDFLTVLDFVRNVVYGLNLNSGQRVSAIKFSSTAAVQFELNDYETKMGVLNALSMSYMGGTTNTAEAIRLLQEDTFLQIHGDRSDAHNIAVIITDGRSDDFDATWAAARNDRDAGIEIMAVGVGDQINVRELEAIVSYHNEDNVHLVNNLNILNDWTNELIDTICFNREACRPNPCQNGAECIPILHGYRCECTEDFSGMHCERACFKKYDIALALDVSGSIRHERFPQIIKFLKDLLDEFELDEDLDDSLIGAVSFSDTAQVEFYLSAYHFHYDVLTALRQIEFRGGRTNIAAALEEISNGMFSESNGARSDAPNYIILVTDGESNIREDETIPMAIRARLDAKLIVLAIGDEVNMLEIRGIASQPSDVFVVHAQSFTEIGADSELHDELIVHIEEGTCNAVDECARDRPCQNGAQCIDDYSAYYCACTNDYSGKNCERRCTNRMDVTFVLDFSGSLDQVFEIVLAFTREVTEGLPYGLDRTRVAVVSYSDAAVLNFDLDDYQSKPEILNALSFSRYGGRTNTAAALQMMYNDVFNLNRGDRSGVDNIAIVVTDGGSNIQRDQTINRALDAKNRGIEVYVAAVYDAPDMREVNGIASDPDNEHVVRVANATVVPFAANQLLDRLCS